MYKYVYQIIQRNFCNINLFVFEFHFDFKLDVN